MTDDKKKVRVYLDVDGCLNSFTPSPGGWGVRKEGKALGYKIQWAPAMLEALDELDVEIVWLTTWIDQAVSELAPLIGWGADFRVLKYTEEDAWMYQRVASIRWKINALVADQAADPSPFIWVDDELWNAEFIEQAEALGGVTVGPDPNFGIRPENIEKMKKYIKEATS